MKNVLKKPELAVDPRFDNPIKRFDHVDFLDELIEEWSSELTRDQAIKQLEEERIPCGKTYSMHETPSHPNLKARGMIRDDFDFSKWNVKKASIPGPLIKFSSCKGSIEKIGPEFGENNKEIYCDLLGYSLDDLKRWKRKKII